MGTTCGNSGVVQYADTRKGANTLKRTPNIHGARLKNAIRQAKAWAFDNGQPLTLERAAVFLGIDRERLLDLVKNSDFAAQFPKDADEIRSLYAFCNAEMADALIKSGRQTGVLLLAKNNYRYAEAEAVGVMPTFVGEDELV